MLWHLGQIFELGPEKIHIFWQDNDFELMGFNQNHTIYLNLAHFVDKRWCLRCMLIVNLPTLNPDYKSLTSSNDDKTAVYTAWYVSVNMGNKCNLTSMQVFHNRT